MSFPVKHGMLGTPEYKAWKSMTWRVKSPHVARWYRDKGITVCQEWRDSFLSFFNHIGRMPAPKMTVERIESDRGYEPGNVKWATRTEQMRHT